MPFSQVNKKKLFYHSFVRHPVVSNACKWIQMLGSDIYREGLKNLSTKDLKVTQNSNHDVVSISIQTFESEFLERR